MLVTIFSTLARLTSELKPLNTELEEGFGSEQEDEVEVSKASGREEEESFGVDLNVRS
jgi:hypothetical protein